MNDVTVLGPIATGCALFLVLVGSLSCETRKLMWLGIALLVLCALGFGMPVIGTLLGAVK